MLLVDEVHAGYGAVSVLRGVSVAVPAGSVVALLGANGAGKTTLLRVASGLLRPPLGACSSTAPTSPRWRRRSSSPAGSVTCPKGRGVFPTMTVRDNVLLQARPGHEREALDRAVTAFPRLGKRMSQIAGTMSGGEQQMLALARAYVQRPAVVLLDEVSMGLAPKIVDEIFVFLRALAAEGTSLLLVEQYVTRALEAADYVYLLDRGRIGFAGEPGEVDSDAIFAGYLGAVAS